MRCSISGFPKKAPLSTPPTSATGVRNDPRSWHGTSYQSGAKSTGAWMSHSSVSGLVNASKEKRLCSEAGGVAVKLGGQENRAAPAEGEMVVCAGPVLQGAPIGPLVSTSWAPQSSYHAFPLSCRSPTGAPISAIPTLVLPTSIRPPHLRPSNILYLNASPSPPSPGGYTLRLVRFFW